MEIWPKKQSSQNFKDIHREVGSFSSTHNEGPSDIHKWWEMGGGGQLGGTGEVGRQGDKQKLLRSSTLSLFSPLMVEYTFFPGKNP